MQGKLNLAAAEWMSIILSIALLHGLCNDCGPSVCVELCSSEWSDSSCNEWGSVSDVCVSGRLAELPQDHQSSEPRFVYQLAVTVHTQQGLTWDDSVVWASVVYHRQFLGWLESILALSWWSSYKIIYLIHNIGSTTTLPLSILALNFLTFYLKGRVKVVHSCWWELISKLLSITCHMGWITKCYLWPSIGEHALL